MLMSLQGALNYLKAVLPAKDIPLLDPLVELYRVLRDLEVNGNRAPALAATRRGNTDSDAAADVKARAIVIAQLWKANTGCSRKEADKRAAALLADAATVAGIADPIDAKMIESWRRSIRSRRAQNDDADSRRVDAMAAKSFGDAIRSILDASMRESLAELFPRLSLADRVENIRAEMLHQAKVLERLDGAVDLDKLIEMVLPNHSGRRGEA
jgi:hypothetical protein